MKMSGKNQVIALVAFSFQLGWHCKTNGKTSQERVTTFTVKLNMSSVVY